MARPTSLPPVRNALEEQITVKLERYEATGFIPKKRATSVAPYSKPAPVNAATTKNRVRSLLQQAQHRRRLTQRSLIAVNHRERSRSTSTLSQASTATNTTSGLRLEVPKVSSPLAQRSAAIVIDDDDDSEEEDDDEGMAEASVEQEEDRDTAPIVIESSPSMQQNPTQPRKEVEEG
ncbi:hypothetical protein CBS101457_002656 [Exobasidium rhododendri]|nr:hypothetical protein CBS101457_002656 [Exobasidium rhododendri]